MVKGVVLRKRLHPYPWQGRIRKDGACLWPGLEESHGDFIRVIQRGDCMEI